MKDYDMIMDDKTILNEQWVPYKRAQHGKILPQNKVCFHGTGAVGWGWKKIGVLE